ncbi:MAG: flagellar motor switch phosphatase FliY [Anaeromicrobium sp.]|uniref:flagellar motor switch phosphatase FliY n=1 Tax=Anaeromicrobium sp. TaxID=1929132 RepID=UPI0025E03491|nr:flagellar motor switch phosphatase FliY [Anaeromicrobium sp.]MCT4595591.1 flagellar motor switch phosphatase FliY [Anaeromicrobium sp.]
MADMLSQEEIDALLNGTSQAPASTPSDSGTNNLAKGNNSNSDILTDDEKDALGEMGNISMGTSATTLFTLLGQRVNITTPKVTVLSMVELADQYPIPFVAVEVGYKEGIKGTNLLVLKEEDVKIITDLMMGGDGTNTAGELTELHLSAIGEAMNQMVGSSSTSLSEMFNSKIDINPPKATSVNFAKSLESFDFIDYSDDVVKVAFRMEIGDLIDSEIMQIIPIEFAKDMVRTLYEASMGTVDISEDVKEEINLKEESTDNSNNITKYDNIDMSSNNTQASPGVLYNTPIERNEPTLASTAQVNRSQPVNVQPVQFDSFDNEPNYIERGNIGLIRDVPLEVTVELGRTTKKISEILSFSPGTVIELDKLVGEPLDILVNGQFMAKGEVVVIDENYGIRVTDIIKQNKK